MSLIRVDNFGPSAGGTTYSAGGIAKAWVNFNGTGTIAVRDSENVSSITDNGTGDYTVSFSSVFASNTYANSFFGGEAGVSFMVTALTTGGKTTNSYRSVSFSNDGGTTAKDGSQVNEVFHGDLA